MAHPENESTNTYVVRYPDGSSEFRLSPRVPRVGDVLAGRGQRWLVADVEDAQRTPRVLLRPAAAA